MKNTKKNVIELLKKIRTSNYEVARIYEKSGDSQEASKYVREATALSMVIGLLTDNDFFNKINDNYNK